MKKINTWQITTMVLAVLFVLSLFNVFSFSSGNKITGNAVVFINENLLDGTSQAVLQNTEKVSGVYKVSMLIDNQPFESYITMDGKLLFPTAVPLDSEIQAVQNTQPQIIDVEAADGPFLGPEDSENVVIVFSDFECPFCGLAFDDAAGKARFGQSYEAAVPILEQLAEEGKIKFVYRHFPLSFHPNAMNAALASECANEQDMFWKYHDLLFMNQDALVLNDLKQYASDLGLNTVQFNECLDSKKHSDKINKDIADGSSYGVSGTPAFFVNGYLLEGSQPFSKFEPALNL